MNDELVRKKIVYLITSLDFGGAETQVCCLAVALKRKGWEVLVVSMCMPQAHEKELNDAGIDVRTLAMRRGVLNIKAFFRLADILRCWQPDVLHGHMVHANLLARVVRLFVRVPIVVCTAHNIYEGGGMRDWWYRLTDFICDMTTQVSQAGLDQYIQKKMIHSQKALFVPNGVNTKIFYRNEEARRSLRNLLNVQERFFWLAVGRLEEAKDYFSMINAFKTIWNKNKSALLLIVGVGGLREKLEAFVKASGLDDAVKFLGIRRDVPDLMSAADGYVMSSAWEGMPMVLLEASACELPVVITDVGGNQEILCGKKTGFLVPPKDSAALAGAMDQVMSMAPEKRRQMGKAGKAFIEDRYELDRIVDTWERLYMKLLNNE